MPIQARTEFAAALNQLASEKGVDVNVVIEAIQQAALAAYRKDLSLRGEEIPEDFEELTAEVGPASGAISIMRGKDNITPPGFARIAAQTAKQVIMQRLHEAEKDAIMDEYATKVGTVISGSIQRQEGNTYFVDLGRAEGLFPPSEQTRDEYYHLNQRLKFYIKEIREGRRGPEVIVSRADPNLVKGLFTAEVPEVAAGSVVIKDIAREAGSRTKISAVSIQEGIDPVGTLVGQKGSRVQTVMNELGEERIDIISYSEDPARYIASALSPAKDVQVTLEEKDGEKKAKIKVASSQLSLAIGKGGQNARLAAKLTGWKIDIEGLEGPKEAKEALGHKTDREEKAAAEVVEEAKDALEVGEQPIPTDEGAKIGEGRESVVEGVETAIDEAEAEDALDGVAVSEPTDAEQAAEPDAAAEAEKDIIEEDAKEKESEAEKLAENKGSFDPSKDRQAGPDEEQLKKDEEKQGPSASYAADEPAADAGEEVVSEDKVKETTKKTE